MRLQTTTSAASSGAWRLGALAMSAAALPGIVGTARGQVPAPQVFAPGVISGGASDGAPTFSPDGRTLYFTRIGNTWPMILESHLVGGRWMRPVLAGFSGEWADLQPGMAPDGSYLIFVSTRPVVGDTGAGPVAHLWRVNRVPAGWGAPMLLPAAVHISAQEFRPSLAADGTLYFMAMVGPRFRLFRTRVTSGTYGAPEPLTFSDGSTSDVDPEIAPDQSYLLFSSTGRTPSDSTHAHLFIVQRAGDGWGEVRAVHYTGETASNDYEPRLSPDLRTLYFSSDRTIPISLPRTRAQAVADAERISLWDDGYTNVWTLPLETVLKLSESPDSATHH